MVLCPMFSIGFVFAKRDFYIVMDTEFLTFDLVHNVFYCWCILKYNGWYIKLNVFGQKV